MKVDLRPHLKTPESIARATQVLGYQPFTISDDIHTGVAYSWLHHEEGGRRNYLPTDFVFDKKTCPAEVWEHAKDANSRLSRMYDGWLDALASVLPGASVAEVGCNTGYFLVGAQRRGMGPCTGVDIGNYGASIEFLNHTLGTDVTFLHAEYDSWKHVVPGLGHHDLVIASAIMQHISDPLYLLSFLGGIATKALFLFVGMGDTEQFLVYYSEPNKFDKSKRFPVCFDNDVGLSRGLLMKSLSMLGFVKVVELPWQHDWLPLEWKSSQKALICLRE